MIDPCQWRLSNGLWNCHQIASATKMEITLLPQHGWSHYGLEVYKVMIVVTFQFLYCCFSYYSSFYQEMLSSIMDLIIASVFQYFVQDSSLHYKTKIVHAVVEIISVLFHFVNCCYTQFNLILI